MGIDELLRSIWVRSHRRGRDGRGHVTFFKEGQCDEYRSTTRADVPDVTSAPVAPGNWFGSAVMLGNLRAEPTTEYVKDKQRGDQQPYQLRGWTIVHNGTIANDKALRTNELPTTIDSAAIVELLEPGIGASWFARCVAKLKGSFAILAHSELTPGVMYAAVNYRPLWYIRTELGFFFASSREFFPEGKHVPVMVEPYSVMEFSLGATAPRKLRSLKPEGSKRALVVCSGGLDSVVSARWAQREGYDVTLLHFHYGSRAQGPETAAVQAVAGALGVPLILQQIGLYRPTDSPLLDAQSTVAGGEAGAEFAYEWVPARNLLMLAMATALAEARGIQTIVLGNNLEEAGAYPDNEPEFIDRFNDVLPFAVGDGKSMKVIMPVGNMMKHEIVALGHELDAPMHLTWSCYRAGALHCGKCGPCFMRRKAFEINNLPEVIDYEV